MLPNDLKIWTEKTAAYMRCQTRGAKHASRRLRIAVKTPSELLEEGLSRGWIRKGRAYLHGVYDIAVGVYTKEMLNLLQVINPKIFERGGFRSKTTQEIIKAPGFHQVNWRHLRKAGRRKPRDKNTPPDPNVTQQTRDRISAAVKQEGGYVETERAFNEFIEEHDRALGLVKFHHGNPDQLLYQPSTKKVWYREIKDHGAPTTPDQQVMFDALEQAGIVLETWERDRPTITRRRQPCPQKT